MNQSAILTVFIKPAMQCSDITSIVSLSLANRSKVALLLLFIDHTQNGTQ